MPYTRTTWQDYPGNTPINATRLNNIEVGVEEALAGTQVINSQSGSTYTLVLSDAAQNAMLSLTNASSAAVTIPAESAVAFPVGAVVNLIQLGAGQVTVAGDTGVTLNSEGSKFKTKAQYAVASLLKTGNDSWVMFGNVAT